MIVVIKQLVKSTPRWNKHNKYIVGKQSFNTVCQWQEFASCSF